MTGHRGPYSAVDLGDLVDLGGVDESWVTAANCLGVDPELFFPGRGESTRAAKEVCAGCTVRTECLDHAIAVPERFGVWGGLSERERRRYRQKVRNQQRAALISGQQHLRPVSE